MRVSVVMVCYNGADLLPEALASLRAQTHEDWELVFFDNGSTDGSADLLPAFDVRARVFGGGQRLTNGAARAAAVAEARGDYLTFLDHDDLWREDKLERQLGVLSEGDADLCYSDCLIIDAAGRELGRYARRVRPHVGDVRRALLEENFIPTVTVMLKRSAYEKAGPFDPALGVPADYDLWMRVARGGPVAYLDEPLASYRIRPGSLTADMETAYTQVDALLESLAEGGQPADDTENRWIARGRAFHRWRWAVRGLAQGSGLAASFRHFARGWRLAGGPFEAAADLFRFLLRLPRGLGVRRAMSRARRPS